MEVVDRKIAPAFKQVNDIDFLPVEKSQLHNGIALFYINGGSQEILKIDFIFKSGNWYNTKPLIASTTNKLIKEGTANYTAYEIAENIDQYGAFLEVQNSFDTASVSLYTLTKYLHKVLPFLKEVLLYPTFEEEEFNIYVTNAFEKFKINQEKVSFLARNCFSENLFSKNHPYGKIATESAYQNLTTSDIKAFHESYYSLNNCYIIVSGNVNAEVIKELNTCFGEIELKENIIPHKQHSIPNNNRQEIYIEKENALQSAIRIGKIIPNKLHQDYFGLKVLNTILGGYFGSRLMQNIREDKGYTYGIGSGIVSMQNAGYFYIATEVGSDVTDNALKEIYNELEIISNKEVSTSELELVKNYMLGQLLNSCDGAFKMASLFENVNQYHLTLDYYNEYIKAIKNITPRTIKELGVKYFNKETLLEIVVGKR